MAAHRARDRTAGRADGDIAMCLRPGIQHGGFAAECDTAVTGGDGEGAYGGTAMAIGDAVVSVGRAGISSGGTRRAGRERVGTEGKGRITDSGVGASAGQ